MSRREFVSSLGTGLASVTTRVEQGRPVFDPKVTFDLELAEADGGNRKETFTGPSFSVLGPGDVQGFDHGLVLRCNPPPGSTDAAENYLASIDLTDARLPWLLTLPGMNGRPWLTLIVLRDDEGGDGLQPGDPLPTIAAPASALPDPDELAMWAHVEARLEPEEPLVDALRVEARAGTDKVVARLVCPRRLEPRRTWLACVVPTTIAGRLAGTGSRFNPDQGNPGAPAWTSGAGAELPVYYAWSFATGEGGSFEDLARLVHPVVARELPGFGSRTIGVGRPWPHADLVGGTPDAPTISMQGALRVPPSPDAPPPPVPDEEAWSDGTASRDVFRGVLAGFLDAPGQAAARKADPDPDRDEQALAPPLFGSHHTGHQQVPPSGWVQQLNLEVRHRIAASLGARYVQVEQEFLMERAWEQVGEVREANRKLAQAELFAEVSEAVRTKHIGTMDQVQLTTLVDAVTGDVPAMGTSVGQLLADSAVPDGTATTRFRRLARKGGAVDRRATRVAPERSTPSVVTEGLGGVAAVPIQTVAWLTSGATTQGGPVMADTASTYGGATLAGLLGAQKELVGDRTLMESVNDAIATSFGSAQTADVTPPETLRALRATLSGLALTSAAELATAAVAIDVLSQEIDTALVAGPQQLGHVKRVITSGLENRSMVGARPLQPIMAHPRFGFPIGAELLSHWPEWTLPGLSTFPENSCTLLETNPPFVEAALVGLNQELNRELLWREYPTDQAGTPFARFWPGTVPEFPEIARWDDAGALGGHDQMNGVATVNLLVRAEVLRRFPGTLLMAGQADPLTKALPQSGGTWRQPTFALPVDDRTTIFGFDLTTDVVVRDLWMFVLREPMRGTQFGFDLPTPDVPAGTPSSSIGSWADLIWDQVPVDRGFARARTPIAPPPGQAAQWATSSADLAAIAFQRPFQLAFSPRRLLG